VVNKRLEVVSCQCGEQNAEPRFRDTEELSLFGVRGKSIDDITRKKRMSLSGLISVTRLNDAACIILLQVIVILRQPKKKAKKISSRDF
jgi:hypothetical protein